MDKKELAELIYQILDYDFGERLYKELLDGLRLLEMLPNENSVDIQLEIKYVLGRGYSSSIDDKLKSIHETIQSYTDKDLEEFDAILNDKLDGFIDCFTKKFLHFDGTYCGVIFSIYETLTREDLERFSSAMEDVSNE